MYARALSLPSSVIIVLTFALVALVAFPARADSVTLDAPASVPSGSKVEVTWTGPVEEYDTIGIVKAGAPDDEHLDFSSFTFGNSPVKVVTPEPPGNYEIRFLAGKSEVIRARRKLVVTPVTATVSAAATIVGGNSVIVAVTGPANEYDAIGILPAGAPDDERPGAGYSQYTFGSSSVRVVSPEQPGAYEIRYLRGGSGTTLGRTKLTITAAGASVHGPGTAAAGAKISIAVTGPHSEHDNIGILPAGAPDDAQPGSYYAFTFGKGSVDVVVPEQLGEYEIRYLTGSSGRTLAREKLSIGATSASVKGPGKAPAGSVLKVAWQGPANDFDQIVIAPKGAPEDKWAVSDFVFKTSPLSLRAPVSVGEYELRYQTGASGTTLARDALQVTPAQEEPGLLSITAAEGALGASGAVEIILDASGSMLQRIGSARRIDIAKQTLTQLTANVIPAGTPFALRVFGRAANSCQSDLDIPLGPLEAGAVASRVAALEAKSNAKTPIGASLEKVAADLGTVKGERLVILITDGEETCGGSPGRAIQKLRKNGVNVRVNIVGFAVAEPKLAATFRQWSRAGNGEYFDARDAAGLNEALRSAIRPAYQVLDAQNKVIADGLTGGEPVRLMPGKYTVSLKGQKGRSQPATVRAKETTTVRF